MDNEKEEDRNKVTIMTMHSAKGLEFNNVYIAGVEERLFPSAMSMDNPQDLEEERRLFYVAVTRARKRVFISYAKSRYRWGMPTDCVPSRFINDIDPQFVDLPKINKSEAFIFDDYDEGSNPFSRKKTGEEEVSDLFSGGNKKLKRMNAVTGNKGHVIQYQTDPNFKPDNPDLIQIGMKIEHQRFGIGKVIHMEGVSPDKKATVFFQSLGQEKQLLLKFAKLRIVK